MSIPRLRSRAMSDLFNAAGVFVVCVFASSHGRVEKKTPRVATGAA